MADPIVESIIASRLAGQTNEQIKSELRAKEWADLAIDKAFAEADATPVTPSDASIESKGASININNKAIVITVSLVLVIGGLGFAYYKGAFLGKFGKNIVAQQIDKLTDQKSEIAFPKYKIETKTMGDLSVDSKFSIFHIRNPKSLQYFGVVTDQEGKNMFAMTESSLSRPFLNPWGLSYDLINGHVGFSAPTLEGDSIAVVNTTVVSKAGEKVHEILLPNNSDGKRFAYVAEENEKQAVVTESGRGKLYDGIGYMRYSRDGTDLAYIVGGVGTSTVVMNGKEGKQYRSTSLLYDTPGAVVYSASSLCESLYEPGCKESMVINGTEGPQFESIDQVLGTEDEKKIAYIGVNDGKSALVVNGVVGKYYDSIIQQGFFGRDGGSSYSLAGDHSLYAAMEGERQFVVFDGKEGKRYEFVQNLVVAEDGSTYAYVGLSNCKTAQGIDPNYPLGELFGLVGSFAMDCDTVLVNNNQEFPIKDRIVSVGISREGGHVVYGTQSGCTVNLVEVGEFPMLDCKGGQIFLNSKVYKDFSGLLVELGVDSEGLVTYQTQAAFGATNLLGTIGIAGHEFPVTRTDSIPLIISPDGKKYAIIKSLGEYTGFRDQNAELIINNEPSKHYASYFDSRFTDDSKELIVFYREGRKIQADRYIFE